MTAVSLNDNDRESYEQDPNSLTESEPWIARIGSISEDSNDVQRNEERIQKPCVGPRADFVGFTSYHELPWRRQSVSKCRIFAFDDVVR